MQNKFWDDFHIGDKLKTTRITVTETHMVTFGTLTGDFYPLHMDEEYAKTTAYGGRIVHGPLTFCLAVGLVGQANWFEDSIIAWIGVDNLRLLRPVKPGDTIHVDVEVASKKEISKKDRGVVTMKYHVMNQRAEEVLVADMNFMMHRKQLS
jgi:3-hydroxybutyryl-CoA dehydratase